MEQNKDFSHNNIIATEIKNKISELNDLIEKARHNGLSVEIKDNNNVMAANIPPLQVTIFERRDY